MPIAKVLNHNSRYAMRSAGKYYFTALIPVSKIGKRLNHLFSQWRADFIQTVKKNNKAAGIKKTVKPFCIHAGQIGG